MINITCSEDEKERLSFILDVGRHEGFCPVAEINAYDCEAVNEANGGNCDRCVEEKNKWEIV